MSANVQTILIFILGISAALRDESFHLLDVPGEAPCPEAKRVTEPPFPTRFEIPSDRAKLLNFFDTWTLKESSSCAGNPVCEVAVAPRFNASAPLQSTAYITARATCTRLEQSRQLFLCTQNGTDACLAAVRFPPRPWKLRILASPFISATRMQRMDSMHNFVQDLLEVLVFLTVLATLGVMGWLLREIILNRRKRSDDGGEDKTDPHLVVPSSLDIMFEGMLDAVCFIIGCGLLLLAASTFLQKFAFGNNPADMLLLCYPLIFGPFALLRIFMCFNRRLLYHNLFLKGVMIDFSTAASRSDFLLSYTYLGFAVAVAVLLFDALSCVHDRIIGWKAMAIQTVVFTSPLYYMVSSLLNSLRLEQEAINRMCMQKLEQGSDAERVEPSSEHKLTPISEGIFCRAARERQDLNACIELARFEETAERQRSAASFAALEGGQDEDDADDDAETESDYFKTMDMFWVPRLVSGHSNSISLSLVVSMPVVTLLAMLLCLASLAWLIKHRTDVPEIVGLATDVPGLVPNWDFEVMDYALFIPKLHGTTTLSASSQLERTHHMNATMFDGDLQIGETITSTSRQLTQHVPLKRKNSSYPTIIQFLAGTLSQERVYQITALEIHILVRSMLLTGVTKDGSTYEVCYPFRGSWKGRAIAIPRNLSSLRIEAAFQEFHLALPVSENHSYSEFVTVFMHLDEDRITIPAYMRAYAQRSCATLCARNFKCYGYKDVRTGCYFATGPSVPEISCMELHQRKTRQNSRVQISAKFCNTHDADNCAQSTSQNQVVKASLDQQVLTFPKLPSVSSSGKARSRERASVTMQASTSLGSILYPDTPYEVNFIRGTPLVKKLVYTKGTLQETNVKPDGTQTFLLSLSYNPNDLLGSFYVYFGVILEDFTEFEVQWEAPLQLVNLSRQSVYFRRLCEPAFYDFSCCGGHVETYVVKAEIDKWVPKQILRGKVVSKSHPSLFRPGFVEIDLVFEGGGITPLQSIIRKDCMVAICRGQPGVLDACLNSTAENCTDLSLCKERCVSHSMDKCVDKAGMPSMDSERRGDLGYISNVANDLLPEALASKREFLRWLDIEIWESSQKYFTQDVLIDIAEHCSFRSGLLSLFRPGRVNTSFSMVSILEALVRNPSFSFNGPFSQIPVLRAMFHDKKEDFLQPLGSVASVALYQKSLRPFTLAVCLATDPLSPKFVNQDLLAHIIGDMRLAVSHGDLAEVNQSQAVLKALSLCVKRKGKRFQRFSAPECRSRSSGITLKDGSSPSFFALAPTEEAFLNLLPVCETGGWMEKDNRTILHLAAEKNFGRPFVEIMNSKNTSLIPDVNSTYMDTSIVGVGTKTSWVKVVGRAAIHDACRSGCGPCVKALLARDASGRMGLNLTMFPSWWDPVFHPWMMDYLLKSTKRNRHSYRSIWGVQPIHIATLHHCSECLEALVGSSDTSGTSGETLKEVVEATMSLGYTTSYMADLEPDTKGHVQQTDVSDPSCLFSALDLAVLTNCSSCAQILLQAGASASQITLDQDSSMENLPVFDVLPKNGSKVQRCSSLRLTDKRQISYMMMFSWI